MASLLSPKWRWGGGLYVVSVGVLAAFAGTHTSSSAPIIVLYLVSLPTFVATYVPIYVALASVDLAFGDGPGSNLGQMVVFVLGFAITALVNVLLLAAATKAIRAWRRNRSDRIAERPAQ